MDIAAESLCLHEQWQGKLNTVPKMDIKTREGAGVYAGRCRAVPQNADNPPMLINTP